MGIKYVGDHWSSRLRMVYRIWRKSAGRSACTQCPAYGTPWKFSFVICGQYWQYLRWCSASQQLLFPPQMYQTGLRHCPPWFYAREQAPMLSQPWKANSPMLTVHRCFSACLMRLVFSNAAMSLERATLSISAWMVGRDWERSILLRAFSILPVFWQEGYFLTGSDGISMIMTLSMNACISGAWWRLVNYISANPPMECPIKVSLRPKPSFLMYSNRSSARSVMVCVGVCGLSPWFRASMR